MNDKNDSCNNDGMGSDDDKSADMQAFMNEIQKMMSEFSVDKEAKRLTTLFKGLGPVLEGKQEPNNADIFTMLRLVNYNVITVHVNTMGIYQLMQTFIKMALDDSNVTVEMQLLLKQIEDSMKSVLESVSIFSSTMSLIDQATSEESSDDPTDGK